MHSSEYKFEITFRIELCIFRVEEQMNLIIVVNYPREE